MRPEIRGKVAQGNPGIGEMMKWLSDPEVFAVNRIAAHSDHKFYITEEAAAAGSEADRILLNGKWHFSWAERPDAGDTEFWREDRDVSGWDTIPVPGHLELNGYGHPHYTNTTYPWDGAEQLTPPQIPREFNPVGRYVLDWECPESWSGRPVRLIFEGAESALFLWVNGQFVGYSEDSFTPAEFGVTGVIRPGKNRLAVQVVRFCSGSWLEDQDFFRFSGLFRDVVIRALPALHGEDLFVHTDFADEKMQKAVLRVEGFLTGEAGPGTVDWILRDAAGEEKVSGSGVRAVGGRYEFHAEVKKPHLWNGEDPYLYWLELRIMDAAGQLQEICRQRVGFRKVAIEDGVLKLNGKRIIFRGINRHEFSCRTGRVVSREEMLWDIHFLKAHHVNAVRTCHYPNRSEWYELCDENGIYLIDETNMESHGTWQKANPGGPSVNVPGSIPEWEAMAVDRARSMLERDKNHPGILLWSLGNESFGGENLRSMTRLFHTRDASRPVHYESTCHCREFEDVSDVESRMYLPPEGVREYLENEPKKPFVSCEYMHAMGNSLGGMKSYTDLEKKYPGFAGGFIWDYLDQALYTEGPDGSPMLGYGGDFGDRPNAGNFSGDGVLYADRTLSPKVTEMKALYAPVYVEVGEKGVTVINRKFFTETAGYRYVCEILKDGDLHETREFFLPPIHPQVRCSFLWKEIDGMADIIPEKGPEEWVVRVRVLRPESEIPENAFPGEEEIAFGEMVIRPAKKAATKPEPREDFRVIEGDDMLGAAGKDFLIRFPIHEESAISFQSHGREYLLESPRPLFWRALTDNERGTWAKTRLAMWKMADYGSRQASCRWTARKDYLTICYEYSLPGIPGGQFTVSWRVTADGRIRVELNWPGVRDLPEFPALGMVFRLPKNMNLAEYYGLGPEENYIDRNHGVRMGRFAVSARESMAAYLKPQECGNHTQVRELLVRDAAGRGLRFTAENKPFEMSVLPWSAEELELARHKEELPPPNGTWVRILAANAGVGGIDSWGARAEPEMLADSSVHRRLVFSVRMI